MGKHAATLALLWLLAAGTSAGAQSPAPGGMTAVQGFNVAQLIGQLSLYLPEEATRGMYSDFGGRAGRTGQEQEAQAQRGPQRLQNLFTRDPRLFLTREQIAGLLPILIALRGSPLPTPSRARQVQGDVDALLTAAQRAEYERFRKTVQDLIARGRELATSGGGAPATSGYRQQAGNGDQGQGGGTGGQARRGGPGTGGPDPGAGMTPTERRQRQLDAFIKVLQSRQKELGG